MLNFFFSLKLTMAKMHEGILTNRFPPLKISNPLQCSLIISTWNSRLPFFRVIGWFSLHVCITLCRCAFFPIILGLFVFFFSNKRHFEVLKVYIGSISRMWYSKLNRTINFFRHVSVYAAHDSCQSLTRFTWHNIH